MRPTVLIVYDHAEFRRSARALLEAEGFTVIAEAADGDEAIAAVERVRPQIVLLDVQLPGVDGFAVAERLAAGRDPPVVVLISSREAAAYGPRLEAAAPYGFIPKRELSGSALAALVGDRSMRSLRVLLWPAGALVGHGARVGLLRLGRPASLDPRSDHGLDAHRLRAGGRGRGARTVEAGRCWRRPASAGSSGTSPPALCISTEGRSSICSSPIPAAGRPRVEILSTPMSGVLLLTQ